MLPDLERAERIGEFWGHHMWRIGSLFEVASGSWLERPASEHLPRSKDADGRSPWQLHGPPQNSSSWLARSLGTASTATRCFSFFSGSFQG
jgi:hypothetical protein